MDELLGAIIILLVKLIAWVFKSTFRTLGSLGNFVKRAQSGGVAPSRAPAPRKSMPAVARPTAIPSVAAPQKPSKAALAARIKPLVDRLAKIEAAAKDAAHRCAREDANRRFVPSLRWVQNEAKKLQTEAAKAENPSVFVTLATGGVRCDRVLAMVGGMAEQRRDDDLALLVGDSDALADACFRPVVDHARSEGLAIGVTDVATLVGGPLQTWPRLNPAGLAPVVLPPEWATEVAWWPALIHEVGHDVYAAFDSLDKELRARFRLNVAPGSQARLEQVLFGVWLDEVFADAYGVMAAGPAYVRTMSWSFATPDSPSDAVKIDRNGDGTLDEHPPAHLRVVLGCRLLAEMGYPTEADRLEAEWRAQHGGPDGFLFPSKQGWVKIAEDALLATGEAIVMALYEDAFAALGDEPLRSLPGLDYGPREHQSALDAAAQLVQGRMAPMVKDPRSLIAGAVLARFQAPDKAALVMRAARSTVKAIGVNFRRLRLRAEAEAAVEDGESVAAIAGNTDPVADAILLDALLERRRFGRRV